MTERLGGHLQASYACSGPIENLDVLLTVMDGLRKGGVNAIPGAPGRRREHRAARLVVACP